MVDETDDQHLKRLYQAYQDLLHTANDERRAEDNRNSILSEMSEVCKRVAAPIIRRHQSRYHRHGPENKDRYEAEALMVMFKLAENPTIRPDTFIGAFHVSLKNALIGLDRRKKREVPFTDYVQTAKGNTKISWNESVDEYDPIRDDTRHLVKLIINILQKECSPDLAATYIEMLKGNDYQDIAHSMGIRLGTVKRRIHMVREKLRDADGLEQEIESLSLSAKKHLAENLYNSITEIPSGHSI